MCKIAIEANDFPVRINGNGTKVYLPKETRIGLIKTLDKKKTKCKISKYYHNELLTGKIGFCDCFGGLTVPKDKWEEMVKDLDLILINQNKEEYLSCLPSFATAK